MSGLGKANKGLSGFKAVAEGVKKGLEAIKPKAGLLEKAFVSLGKTIKNFAENILQRILVIAFGVLVRDAIRKVIDILGEMVGAVIDAANEFQALEVRLNTFNLNALIEAGYSYNEAMERSIALTKEQLGWTLKLAVSSPYDATDVAAGYSLARSYGFVDKKAKELTDAVLDFASGMGLDNVAIERIITNLGQMVQQGKITGTELRDLARGSFVPVNKVLEMVAKNVGLTTEELDKMRKAGTTDPQWFIDAFIELAQTDFAGAAEKMSRTLPKALGNLKDLFVGLPALKSIKPMFDAIGGGIADIVNAFGGDTERFKQLESIFSRIGKALSDIVQGIFGLLPSTESIADSIIGFFENIATWLQSNKGAIVDWVRNAMAWLKNLAMIIKTEVIPVIQKFFQWISENKETIVQWGKYILYAWLASQALNIVLRLLISALIWFVEICLKAIAAGIGFQKAIKIAQFVLGLLGTTIGTVVTVIGLLLAIIATAIFDFFAWIAVLGRLQYLFGDLSLGAKALGKDIVDGLTNGIYESAQAFFNAIAWLANTAMSIFNSIFDISSPSKVMFDAGMNITKGMAMGITSGAKEVLGVTSALATSVSDILSGAEATGGSITAGISTSNTGEYLSNTGEVMRSNLDVTAGSDPCAKGTAASCAAEKVAGALGGIGSALIGAVGGIGDEILDFVDSLTNYAKKSMDASGEDFKKVDRVLDGNISINEAILGMAKGTNGHIQDARDRIKEIAASATTSTTELANYATEDLKGKSAEFSTGISEIQRLNNDRARTSSAIFIAKVVETNIIGQGIMKYMSTTTVGLIIQLVQVAID